MSLRHGGKNLGCDMQQPQCLWFPLLDRLCVSFSTPRFKRGALSSGNVNGMCCDVTVQRARVCGDGVVVRRVYGVFRAAVAEVEEEVNRDTSKSSAGGSRASKLKLSFVTFALKEVLHNTSLCLRLLSHYSSLTAIYRSKVLASGCVCTLVNRHAKTRKL